MSKIIGTEEKDGILIISTEGYLNKDLALAVMEEASKYIDNGTTNILINLSKSNIVNSIGASIIIELIEKLQEVNGSLSFCELPSIIEKTFKIINAITPPAAAIGTTNNTINGSLKDFIKIVKSIKITNIEITTFCCILFHVLSNSLAAPDILTKVPLGNFLLIGFIKLLFKILIDSSNEIFSFGLN